MIFNKHNDLEGQHAFLSASKYHWLNYDNFKLEDVYLKFLLARRGTELHDFADHCIRMNQKLPRTNKTLNMYVNDAIAYNMTTEQVLYYSDNCYGTADAICFKNKNLRIHDYKSGVTPASMEQLKIYAALFCLEYKCNPNDISMELRIYQNDEIIYHIPTGDEIQEIINKIKESDKLINQIKERAM